MSRANLHVPIPAGMNPDDLDEAMDDIASDARTGDVDASRFWAALERHDKRRKQT